MFYNSSGVTEGWAGKETSERRSFKLRETYNENIIEDYVKSLRIQSAW